MTRHPYVQRKGWCNSVGGFRPTGAKVRSPVAWMASGRETELWESIDKAIHWDGERVIGPQRK